MKEKVAPSVEKRESSSSAGRWKSVQGGPWKEREPEAELKLEPEIEMGIEILSHSSWYVTMDTEEVDINLHKDSREVDELESDKDQPVLDNSAAELHPLVASEEGNEEMRADDNLFSGEAVYRPTTAPIEPDQDHSRFSCTACRKRCQSRCKPFMWQYKSAPTSDSSWREKLKYSIMCPPHGIVARILVTLFAVLLGFGLVWSMTGEEGLPGGTFFGIYVLFLLCSLAGLLMPYIRLPPLLGMLIMGCILGNVPYINVAKYIDSGWSAAIRSVALAVILTRAGLGLDPKALKRMSCVVIRLAFCPCTAEALICMVTAHFLLGFPLIWGLMLGFVLAAVSPAVVVPSLLELSDKGYGVDQGVPTLVIAAASLDDVLAISAFTILLSVAFSDTTNIGVTIVKGPLEALGGVIYGVIVGVITWYLPPSTHKNLDVTRSFLLLCGGLFALFGSTAAGIEGSGALGCLTLPFVAAIKWRQQLPQGVTELPSERHMGYLWTLFQPLLFGLIGAAVDFQQINARVVGLGLAVLLIGLVGRVIVSFLAVLGSGFTLKEKLFIPLAWLPKATVQALIGSRAYDTALYRGADEDTLRWGLHILTIAVLCIILTAPAGAALISLSGPRLLQKSKEKSKESPEMSKIDDDGDDTHTTQPV
ncbi:sodium/hydrogen exchanger 9B2-like [Watersipora subatra]|uniref:sodium/hydrogen exchanger 9B2-like n=1 Tax=Watersipora subatra TaxID=2589382 RepID=UPI00355AE835